MSEQPPEPAAEAAPGQPKQHPVRLIVDDDLRRSRLTVFFRLLLVIPFALWAYPWIFAFLVSVIVNWFAVLIRGRSPEDLHLFLARCLRYLTHVTAYVTLVANPYPTFFGREGSYPVDLEVDPPERQNRWVTGFRLILAIPALILANVLQQVMQIIAFLGWFASLALGRMPKGMRDLSAYCLRYQQQTYAYLLLLTQRYPSLASGPTP